MQDQIDSLWGKLDEYSKEKEKPKQPDLSPEQIETLSKIPQEVLDALRDNPTNWKYIDSQVALSKIKTNTVKLSKQGRFLVSGGNIAAMMIRKDDGTQVIDRFQQFAFVRDPKNRVAMAIFKSCKHNKIARIPIIGQWSIWYEPIERLFNTEIAIPSLTGWLSAFDAGTLEQTPLTNDKNLVPLYHKLDRELNQTIQGLVLANTEADRLKKRGTFWEKYGVNIMLFIAIIILALAIYQNASNIAGLNTHITALGTQISNLGGLLPKITGGLPAT
jgi:hypothetical protein